MQIQFGTSKTIIEAIEAENKFSPLCKSGLNVWKSITSNPVSITIGQLSRVKRSQFLQFNTFKKQMARCTCEQPYANKLEAVT